MSSALRRHAAVVVQKSLVEGFGLTVAEHLGQAARERVRERFLPDRQLPGWARLLERLG